MNTQTTPQVLKFSFIAPVQFAPQNLLGIINFENFQCFALCLRTLLRVEMLHLEIIWYSLQI